MSAPAVPATSMSGRGFTRPDGAATSAMSASGGGRTKPGRPNVGGQRARHISPSGAGDNCLAMSQAFGVAADRDCNGPNVSAPVAPLERTQQPDKPESASARTRPEGAPWGGDL